MRAPHRRSAERGYTLMELTVAAMIALLIIAGLYVVYAGHARVFRGQEMVAQAQVTARFAMEVVKADLRRAGFMAVGDSQDPQTAQRLCSQPDVDGNRIQAITLRHAVGAAMNLSGNAAIPPSEAPDELVLVGNYTDSESYWIDRINGTAVRLQNNTKNDQTDPFPTDPTTFDEIFSAPAGGERPNAVRITHQNRTHFAVLDGNDGDRTVNISKAPGCLPGLWDGAQLNVVNKVRYTVVPAQLTASETAIKASQPGLANRFDLVRDVLDWTEDDSVNTNFVSRQVVAENVVDFQVWFYFDTRATPTKGPTINQTSFPMTDNLTGGPPCNNGTLGAGSCMIRDAYSAVVRLSVRTAREDPNFLMPSGTLRPLQWYEVDPDSEGAARVRTIVTQVDLPNIGYGQ